MQAPPLGERWRARELEAQDRALAAAASVLSCPAPIDSGGLGRHLRELHEALLRGGSPTTCLTAASPPTCAEQDITELPSGALARAARPLGRFSRAWRMWAANADFDRSAARALPAAQRLIAFNGAALAQLRNAGRAGFDSLELVSANSHYRNVVRQHERAFERHPIERPWVARLLARNLAEYPLAGRILYSSRYIRESFLREGFDESLLVRFPLTPDARFTPQLRARQEPELFEIVFVGTLTVHKGVPLLVDALRQLPQRDLRLVLVGGWATRSMRRYLQAAAARDPRIVIAPGRTAERLRSARLCVHPAWEEGFGYGPAEALSCGIPVIASADTGMGELIDPGRTGAIVPTGAQPPLVEAIESAYRGELLR